MSEADPKYGPGWSLSEYEKTETERLLLEILGFLEVQQVPVHRYMLADILREVARKVENYDL